MKNIKNKEIEPYNNIYLGMHATFSSSAEMLTLSVDFSRSGIWGELGTGVQGICLKSCAKYPPNRTMCSRDAIRPQPFRMKMEYLLSLTSGDPKLTFEKVRQPKTKFMTSVLTGSQSRVIR